MSREYVPIQIAILSSISSIAFARTFVAHLSILDLLSIFSFSTSWTIMSTSKYHVVQTCATNHSCHEQQVFPDLYLTIIVVKEPVQRLGSNGPGFKMLVKRPLISKLPLCSLRLIRGFFGSLRFEINKVPCTGTSKKIFITSVHHGCVFETSLSTV